MWKFLNDWDSCLQNMQVRRQDQILEQLFKAQISTCDHFKNVNALYQQEGVHQGKEKSFEKNKCKSPRIAPDRPGSPKAIRPQIADRPYLMVV